MMDFHIGDEVVFVSAADGDMLGPYSPYIEDSNKTKCVGVTGTVFDVAPHIVSVKLENGDIGRWWPWRLEHHCQELTVFPDLSEFGI